MKNLGKRVAELERSILGKIATEKEEEEDLKKFASLLFDLDEKYIELQEFGYRRSRILSSYEEYAAIKKANQSKFPPLEQFDFETVAEAKQYCRGLSIEIREGRIQEVNEVVERLPSCVILGLVKFNDDLA